jgi:hypothetical protein
MAWTPSIVPHDDDDQNVYLVVDDFGRNGRSYREADVEATDLETVIIDLLTGEYKNRSAWWPSTPPRSGLRMYRPMYVAHELRQRCDLQMRDVPFGLEEFMDRHKGRCHDVQLPLPMRLA